MLDKLSVFLSSVLPSGESERKSVEHRGEECLNCGQKLELSFKYCPNCSQTNSKKQLEFKDFFLEFFAGIFAYDSRLMRTLRILLLNPGRISKEYIGGRRMRYANPFRFYLSVSILFFLMTGILNKIEEYSGGDLKVSDKKVQTFDNTDVKPPEDVPGLEKKETVPSYTEEQINSMSFSKGLGHKLKIYSEYYPLNKEEKPEEALSSLGHEISPTNIWLYKKVVHFNFFKENPDIAYNYFISKLPFVIFFFNPLFAFFIYLLYLRKRRFTYMEHLIFTFYVQSLLFVLLILTFLLDFVFQTQLFTTLLLVAFLFYLYKAMRRFYGQGRFKTLIKFVIINSLFVILAVFTAAFYALLSFSLY